jgi:hypothetical protein
MADRGRVLVTGAAGDHAFWVTGTILRVDEGSSTGAQLPVHWPDATDIQKGTTA